MSTITLTRTPGVTRLDYDLLRRVALIFGILNLLFTPLMVDPLAYAGGAWTPWLLLRIIGTPTMPAAAAYLFLWQWMQVFARILQAQIDGEPLGAGIHGMNVTRAYWYMLASLVVMAVAFRVTLSGLRPASYAEAVAHVKWRPPDLIIVYIGAIAVSLVFAFAGRLVPSLFQAVDVASRLKVVALFVLCTYTLSTGQGMKFMLGAVFFEILVGFTGFFSDFRGVFIYVAVAAIASRIRWTTMSSIAAVVWVSLLLVLALFWTAIKHDYRIYASQSDESQEIKVPLTERMAYLGDKLTSADGINWSDAAYTLLVRLAYVDIFGAVIGVQETSPESEPYRQWGEALGHVFQPRFLFPEKPQLLDSDVYMRLARGDPAEHARTGTSISVGYMGENFADFGFPGMLFGIAFLGVMLGLVTRLFMASHLPLMVREGIVMGFVFSMARDGVEVSLPKVLGGMFMFFLVFSLIARFGFPIVVRWLDTRAAEARARASSPS
ncbi:MAG: hypothetical protein AB7F22_07395 [Reyranella sp.]|uniref:hypothetical protein n=1 Tax=Reyranella sp. TaxID=1929291 RepID=UPI003D12B959